MNPRPDEHLTAKNAVCPCCLMGLDAATNARDGETASPEEGDLSVCAYCGSLLRFQDDLSMKELADADFQELRTKEPDLVKTLLKAQYVIRNVLKHKPEIYLHSSPNRL